MMNKKNAYVCGRLHQTVTEDIDAGTTPMVISCPSCPTGVFDNLKIAQSLMYRIDQNIEATHVFYKPTDEQLADMAADMHIDMYSNIIEHVKKGGLLLKAKEEGGVHA